MLLISKSNSTSLHCLPNFHGKGLQTITFLPDWRLWCRDCDSCPAEQHYTIKCWAIWSFWLCSFIFFSLVLQIPMPCSLVPRGRHFCNFDSLPNIFRKCKALLAWVSSSVQCQKAICIFSLVYPNSKLSFPFTFCSTMQSWGEIAIQGSINPVWNTQCEHFSCPSSLSWTKWLCGWHFFCLTSSPQNCLNKTHLTLSQTIDSHCLACLTAP